MYEDQTSQVIEKRMLDTVSPAMDKREGSIIHDATAPVSIELELMYAALDWFMKNTFGDTAERQFLIERALERGLVPYKATRAVVRGIFTPSALEIPIGHRFSCNGINYAVTEKLKAGSYLLRCETVGVSGNKEAGMLVPIDNLPDLQSAKIEALTIPAIDDEDTEVFRQRYLKSFETQAYGGNIADYKEKVLSIAGVGGVKVYPVWNGGGTVKVVFCTSEFKSPDSEFVNTVQEMLDPVPYHQKGVGVAPIGHYVTVAGVTEKTINIKAKISVKSGFVLSDIKPKVTEAINDYLKELNREWKNTQTISVNEFTNIGLIVRVSKIESCILDVTGVLDVEESTINGSKQNLQLGVDEIVKLGGLTYE
jgi:uncharacterized phage protein gp47/JayE